MNYLMLYKPGALTKQMVERARRAGYCCIEAEDFEAVKIVDASIPANKDELFKLAMLAIHTSGPAASGLNARTIFGTKVSEALSK